MIPNLQKSTNNKYPLIQSFPNTGLIHHGFPWWLFPSGFGMVQYINLKWEELWIESMSFLLLDIFFVLLPIQLFYLLIHNYIRPQLKFGTTFKGSFICNLLVLLLAHPFVLLQGNMEMYHESGEIWWLAWFIDFADVWEIIPVWCISSIALTLLEVVLNKREETEDVEILATINKNNLPISQSKSFGILMIESTQQYKTIYSLTKDGVQEEIVRKSFEELIEDSGKTLFQVHKSYMVAPEYIEKIKRDGRNSYLILQHLPKPVPVSRNKLKETRKLLQTMRA